MQRWIFTDIVVKPLEHIYIIFRSFNMAYNPTRDQTAVGHKKSPIFYGFMNIRDNSKGMKRFFYPLSIIFITVLAGLSFFSITVIGILFGGYKYFQSSDLIAPGVNVLGYEIGTKNSTEAAILLHKNWNIERQITASDGENDILISPNSIGITIDPIDTARNALKIGRTGDFLADLQQIFYSSQNGYILAPIVEFDQETALTGLESLTPEMSLPPKDVGLKMEGGQLVEIPGEIGYTINIEETIKALENDPYSIMVYGSAKIILKPVMPRINDVSVAIDQANKLMESRATIRAYDPIENEYKQWQVTPQDVSQWIKIETGDNGLVVLLDENLAADFFSRINSQIGPERSINERQLSTQLIEAVKNNGTVSTEVDYRPTQYKVRTGDTLLKISWNLGIPFWKIIQANPGLNPDNVIAGTELTIPAKDELLPLPVIQNKRIKISISQQKLWIYENGEVLGQHLISTGIDKSPTQPGVFQVQSHQRNAYASVWDLYMPNFIGIYEAWPGFMNGIHGLPTLSSGTRLWENILGEPASYGCIILDLETSEWLYNWAEEGVIVEIEP